MKKSIFLIIVLVLMPGLALAVNSKALNEEFVEELKVAIDDRLKELKTALIMCKYYACKDTQDGKFIYQTKSKEYWYYAGGEIIDIDKVKVKEK